MKQFQTHRQDFTQTRIADAEPATLHDGHVRVKIDLFSITANNITYAATGDRIGYWQFFRAIGDAPGWGVIPVWGFADVVESRHEGVPVGARLFGYFPPATMLDMHPDKVSARGFTDAMAHRTPLPAGYNRYLRMDTDPTYDPARDAHRALLYPLHVTSFALWDALQMQDFHGADQIILTSASSKTSLGLAYALHTDPNAPAVIGLTSPSNTDFVEGTGYYDSVHAYDDLARIDAATPAAIVDMSGNSDVLGRLHTHLGEAMRFTHFVGLTHWDVERGHDGVNHDRSAFFFAPGHIQTRIVDWGLEKWTADSLAFLARSSEATAKWMEVQTTQGLNGLAGQYGAICNGTYPATKGLIVKM